MTKIINMDQSRAQRLLVKIQTLVDQGSPLSKLEQDLVKSYILQLYEAVTETAAVPEVQAAAAHTTVPPVHRPVEQPVRVPSVPIPPPSAPKAEVEAKWEPVVDHHRVVEEVVKPEPRPVVHEKISRVETPEPERFVTPEPEPVPTPEPEPHIPAFTPPPVPKVATPVAETPRRGEPGDALRKLFEPPAHSEPTGANVLLSSIEEGIGINDRIFILNDLFGGDGGLMRLTFDTLNGLSSFSEARNLLLHGVAERFDWAHPEHEKKAVEFIRIVRRRYPPQS